MYGDDLNLAIRYLFALSYPDVQEFIGADLMNQLLDLAKAKQQADLEAQKADLESQLAALNA